jgi:hypothetical protein
MLSPTGFILFGCVNKLRVRNKLDDFRIFSRISGREKVLRGVSNREIDQQTTIFEDFEGVYILENSVLGGAEKFTRNNAVTEERRLLPHPARRRGLRGTGKTTGKLLKVS